MWHLWGHPPNFTNVVHIPLFTETPLFLSDTWRKQVVCRLNLFLHYDKTYFLSNDIAVKVDSLGTLQNEPSDRCRVQLKRDGTRWRTGGEVKGKLANGVGSQSPSHRFTLPRNMVYPALQPLMRTPRLPAVDWTDAPRRFKCTRPFRRKTRSGFCACAIMFHTQSSIQSISCSPLFETQRGHPLILLNGGNIIKPLFL